MVAKVSIVVPVYRVVESYLRKCIDTLTNQTLKEIEILLVDDGSPDNCGQICDEYAAKDERIVVIHQSNQGVSVARNTGVRHATGDYILFADPDDWLELDCCERVIAEMDQQQSDALFFQAYRETESGHCLDAKADHPTRLKKAGIRMLQLDSMIQETYHFGVDRGTPWGRLIRRKYLIDNEIWFTPGIKKEQDLIWHLYLYEHLDEAYVMDYTGYHYRVHGESVCSRYNPNMPEYILAVHYEAKKFVQQYHPDDEDFARALGLCQINNVGSIMHTTLFHPEHPITYKQMKQVMMKYLNDNLQLGYIQRLRYKDMPTRKTAVRFLILKYHCFAVLYIYQRVLLRCNRLYA